MLQPKAPISIVRTSPRPASATLREPVKVNTIISPNKISATRSPGVKKRVEGKIPIVCRLTRSQHSLCSAPWLQATVKNRRAPDRLTSRRLTILSEGICTRPWRDCPCGVWSTNPIPVQDSLVLATVSFVTRKWKNVSRVMAKPPATPPTPPVVLTGGFKAELF